jgi:uncharacterized BrkB/YihY/UPF0761 family membrane protein
MYLWNNKRYRIYLSLFLDIVVSFALSICSFFDFCLPFIEKSNHEAFSDVPTWMGETISVLLVLAVVLCRISI